MSEKSLQEATMEAIMSSDKLYEDLSDDKYNSIAKDIAAGKSISSKDADAFYTTHLGKQKAEVIKKYGLNEKEQEDLENAISYFDYLLNEGVYFSTPESVLSCFVDEFDDPVEVSQNTIFAFAEYLKNTLTELDYATNEGLEDILNSILNNKDKQEEAVEKLEEEDWKFVPGYHEWLLQKDGETLYTFNDFVGDLPEVCNRENLMELAEELTERLFADEDLDLINIDISDKETIAEIIFDSLYAYYGELSEEELASQLYGVDNNCEYTPKIEENKKLKTEDWFGVKDAKYIYHGDWSDPEVSYRGYLYNYYDIEEFVLDCMYEDYEEEGKELPPENSKEYNDLFNHYMEVEVPNALYDLNPTELDPSIIEYLENGIVSNGLVDLIQKAQAISKNSTFEGLIERLESLKETTDIPEEKINEAIKVTKDFQAGTDIDDSYDEDERYEEAIPVIEDILADTSDLFECKSFKVENKKLTETKENETYSYKGYTFIPVGNIKSNLKMYDYIRKNDVLTDKFDIDKGTYNYEEFYRNMPPCDIFEIPELKYKKVVPGSNFLFEFTGDESTFVPFNEVPSENDLRKEVVYHTPDSEYYEIYEENFNKETGNIEGAGRIWNNDTDKEQEFVFTFDVLSGFIDFNDFMTGEELDIKNQDLIDEISGLTDKHKEELDKYYAENVNESKKVENANAFKSSSFKCKKLTENEEPEENKKLDFEQRVKLAYENCNCSGGMPTIQNIVDYLDMNFEYDNDLHNEIGDILYKLGYDWKLESKQLSGKKLTENEMTDLAKELPDEKESNEEEIDKEVTGVVDGILVITDPEIDEKNYEEVIEKAKDIVEDTPEGEIPFIEDYIGQYIQTCPICGKTFVSKQLLQSGDTCPLCLEQPSAFITVGKVNEEEQQEQEMEQNGEFDNDINIERDITEEDTEEVKEETPEDEEL